nr:alpha/beta hydrolase [Candidatus Freyarchaeota archaeon]
MPLVNVNGLKTFYESRGKGRPLILIHGAGGSSEYWSIQLSELSKKLRVIAIDLPGHGKSERLKERVSIERYAEHVAGFVKQIKLDQAVILGHSMGGLVVQQLALKHPELIEKLIIVDSAAKFPGSGPPEFADRVRNQPETLSELLPMFFSKKTLSEGNLASILKHLQPSSVFDPNVLADDFEAAGAVDFREKIKGIAVPTLIIVGAEDILPLSLSQFLHENIKESEIEIIPDAGHLPMLEKPDEFNRAILMFLGA